MRKSAYLLLLLSFLCINYTFSENDPVIDSKQIEPTETGNWYEKLHWWKKAKPEYEKISANIAQVKKYQKEIADKRTAILPKINQMFQDLKIEKEQIISKIDQIIEQITKELDEFDIEEEQKQKELLDNQKDLQTLKVDLQALIDLEKKIDESILNTLVEQAQSAENYEEKALNSFEQIEDVLDDKKARLLYETIENSNENIKNILDYINGALRQFVNESSAKIDQLISSITVKVKDLKQRGVVLKRESEDKAKKAKKAEIKKEIKVPKKEVPISWWQKIINFIWHVIKAPFEFIYGFFK